MKHIFEFFQDFEDPEISITELAQKFNCQPEGLALFFGDYDNYRQYQDFCEKYYIQTNYFNQQGDLVDDVRGPKFLNPDYIEKAFKIVNRYYKNPQRQIDMFLAEHLFGYKPKMGQIDDSDIGGIYRSAWVYHDDYEIPFYTSKEPVDNLFNHLPKNLWQVSFENGIFSVTTKYSNIQVTQNHSQLSMAVGLAIKEFLFFYRKEKFIVQRAYDESFSGATCISPMFFSYSEAENFKNHQEEHEELFYIIVSL